MPSTKISLTFPAICLSNLNISEITETESAQNELEEILDETEAEDTQHETESEEAMKDNAEEDTKDNANEEVDLENIDMI